MVGFLKGGVEYNMISANLVRIKDASSGCERKFMGSTGGFEPSGIFFSLYLEKIGRIIWNRMVCWASKRLEIFQIRCGSRSNASFFDRTRGLV